MSTCQANAWSRNGTMSPCHTASMTEWSGGTSRNAGSPAINVAKYYRRLRVNFASIIYNKKCQAVTVLGWEGHNLMRDYQLGGWGVQIQNTFPRLSRWQKQHGKRPIALGGWGGWVAVPSDTDGSVKITHNNYIHRIC